MPRRAIVALTATALGLILLFSFKTPDDAGLSALGGARGRFVTTPGGAATPSPLVRPSPSPARGGTGSGRSTPGPTQPAATPPAAGGTLHDGTVQGQEFDTRYGPVQVSVTIQGGRIADIQALQLPFDHPRSEAISQYVEPILRSEALQAQSAQIDLVSGATYTSDAYSRSLQSALDQAGA